MCAGWGGGDFIYTLFVWGLPTHGESWAVAGLQNPSRSLGLAGEEKQKEEKQKGKWK